MPYSAAGVEYANSYGVYGKDIGLTDQLENMSLNDKAAHPTRNFTGWNLPKLQVDGGKGKRSNSRKKIRKNRRANKTRRYKK